MKKPKNWTEREWALAHVIHGMLLQHCSDGKIPKRLFSGFIGINAEAMITNDNNGRVVEGISKGLDF